MTDWLARLRDDLIAITTDAARVIWRGVPDGAPPYFNYRLEHVRQVERDALRLLDRVGGDRDVVLASVWLHDRFKPQHIGDHHAARAGEWARANLAAYGFPPEKIARVIFAVANHSRAPGALPDDAPDARVLWDADKVGKVGALEIVMFLAGNPAFPHKPNTFATIAQHGFDKVDGDELFIAQFYFAPTREWARERLAAKRAFYTALAREIGLDQNG
ncbi:MAG: hypothetical protein HZC40_09910 [Chloroflexi bacterium]|nr:hypothetical protein [Chloroflexota bacterium]